MSLMNLKRLSYIIFLFLKLGKINIYFSFRILIITKKPNTPFLHLNSLFTNNIVLCWDYVNLLSVLIMRVDWRICVTMMGFIQVGRISQRVLNAFIEGQAFLPPYDLAPRPPTPLPHVPSVSSSGDTQEEGEGLKGVGEEQNHTTVRKPGLL